MKRHSHIFAIIATFIMAVIFFNVPTIAFFSINEAQLDMLSSLGLSGTTDPAAPDFAQIAMERGIHPDLIFAASGVDVRAQHPDLWRYDNFKWRSNIVIDGTVNIGTLRERINVACGFVPLDFAVHARAGTADAVGRQISDWLATGQLYDMTSFSYSVTGNKLTFFPSYRESTLCAAWLADHSTLLRGINLDGLSRTAQELSKPVPTSGTQYDQARGLHDALIRRTRYLHESMTEGQTASTALIDGAALCAGYSDAYRLLLLMRKIDCQYVIGVVPQDGEDIAHGWNKVKIDGAWYNVDVTWDDSGYEQTPIDSRFFLISDAQIAKTHIWTRAAWPLSPTSWVAPAAAPAKRAA